MNYKPLKTFVNIGGAFLTQIKKISAYWILYRAACDLNLLKKKKITRFGTISPDQFHVEKL